MFQIIALLKEFWFSTMSSLTTPKSVKYGVRVFGVTIYLTIHKDIVKQKDKGIKMCKKFV